MRRALLLSSCLWITASLATAARAQEPTAEATEGDGYRATIESAVAEFAAQHFAEARALFRRAHGIRPNARTLRGLGMSAFELRDYADSVRRLRESLEDTRHALTDEQRAQVNALLERAETFVAQYEFTVPEGASLSVDGVPATFEPNGTLLLALGTHALAVRREGEVLGEARIEVQGGERGPLSIDLVEPDRAPEPEEPLPLTTPVREEPPILAPRDVGGPVALMVTGGVVAVAGAVLLGAGVADTNTVASAPDSTAWSSLEGAYGRAPVLQGVGGAALGLGLAAAAAGVLWLALDTPGSSSVAVTATPTGLALRGTF